MKIYTSDFLFSSLSIDLLAFNTLINRLRSIYHYPNTLLASFTEFIGQNKYTFTTQRRRKASGYNLFVSHMSGLELNNVG